MLGELHNQESQRHSSIAEAAPEQAPSAQRLAARYQEVRRFTERLCEPLVAEDYVVQSMPDVSPTKWHLAHTSWFFETFVLTPSIPGYQPFHPSYGYLFNSYYNAVGDRHERPKRGLLSRPTVEEVFRYRAQVDRCMLDLLDGGTAAEDDPVDSIIELGLHHEQQHQELIVTDIKHVLSCNPLRPAYQSASLPAGGAMQPLAWSTFAEGIRRIGHDGDDFAFDNEKPRHRVLLEGFQLANRPVANSEYLAFVEDAGYSRPELWLSDGWNAVQAQGWTAPLYWEQRDGDWYAFTMNGMQALAPNDPVCHMSYYEADAFARWAGARIPTESEWESAAEHVGIEGNFVESGRLSPMAASDGSLSQMFGDVWEWTNSAYLAYPGYRPLEGALGEYNGKFMCNQFVLRGGSCATPRSHIRRSYRNFFPPDARWQFLGIRLAKDM